MEIEVALKLGEVQSNPPGAELQAIALDGTKREWFKWYPNRGVGGFDAYNMGLAERAETPTGVSVGIVYAVLKSAEIDDVTLDKEWHKRR
ncbi:hypothetical protein [Terriglobus albidus]|uniref:hypothetical protein n=1 Tax=Terriglobus albidus TaxID=1592106 RepID=UPI0021DF4221|nr:hypothetical protein [Terriglobus albidus]